jgi:hypothetical protein
LDFGLAGVVSILRVKSLVRALGVTAKIALFAVGSAVFADIVAAAKGTQ